MPDYYDPVRHLGNPVNHQRMYDFERDMLRVKNPLNDDFTFMYDMMPVVIPAGGTKDMERYLFRRYLWAIIGHIYNQLTEARFDKAHEAFTRTHPDVIDDPYLMNEKIWLKLPRLDDPNFQKKVHDDCLVGVVSRFGANRTLPRQASNGQLDPNTPLFQQLINEDKTLITDLPAEPATAPLLASQPLQTTPASLEEATL